MYIIGHEYEWVGVCGVSVQAGNILVIEELACVCVCVGVAVAGMCCDLRRCRIDGRATTGMLVQN